MLFMAWTVCASGLPTPTYPPLPSVAVVPETYTKRPRRTARDTRTRPRETDRRLADIESSVTTENRSLAREIEQLR